MAKKSIVQRQKKRENLVLKYKVKRENLLKELKMTSSFSETLELQKKLQKLPLNSAKNRLRNRCWKTGRGRAFYRDFGVCRHVLREMAHEGLLPGVIKSSW
uniref:Small ribosomal subunit protein uS14c n=1 Tax=Aureoumbra lagunensis TaxID=44058 RepID=C6KIY5_9STRA|nr:30S ribosomal protein S14 [Aureoumbra lagunensis]ACS36941.1 30S ribosomal protein S14 [Aureoumbra lagunensis]